MAHRPSASYRFSASARQKFPCWSSARHSARFDTPEPVDRRSPLRRTGRAPCSAKLPPVSAFESHAGFRPVCRAPRRLRKKSAAPWPSESRVEKDDSVPCRAARLPSRKMLHDVPHRRSEEHTSELQSRPHLVCRLLLEKKKKQRHRHPSRQKTNNNHERS